MTNSEQNEPNPETTGNAPATENQASETFGYDPGTTDLGPDVYRDTTNSGSTLGDATTTGLEGGIDPGTTDLGNDVYRNAGNSDVEMGGGGYTGLEGGIDPRTTDLGDDVYREA